MEVLIWIKSATQIPSLDQIPSLLVRRRTLGAAVGATIMPGVNTEAMNGHPK
jgi:hypothetical protein